MRKDLPICKSQSEMKEIQANHFNHFNGLNFNHKPCNLLIKVNYEVTEKVLEESSPDTFTIHFNYKDDQVKVIQMNQAFGIGSLLGNIGGYVGLFLGYALLSIPEILKNISQYFNGNSNTRSRVNEGNGITIEEDVNIDTLRFQISRLEKRINEMQM